MCIDNSDQVNTETSHWRVHPPACTANEQPWISEANKRGHYSRAKGPAIYSCETYKHRLVCARAKRSLSARLITGLWFTSNFIFPTEGNQFLNHPCSSSVCSPEWTGSWSLDKFLFLWLVIPASGENHEGAGVDILCPVPALAPGGWCGVVRLATLCLSLCHTGSRVTSWAGCTFVWTELPRFLYTTWCINRYGFWPQQHRDHLFPKPFYNMNVLCE